MKRLRLARFAVLLIAFAAMALSIVSFSHRARAGSNAPAKKAKAAHAVAPATAAPLPSIQLVASATASSAPVVPIVSASPPAAEPPIGAPEPATTAAAEPSVPPIEQVGKDGPDLTTIPKGGGLPVMVDIAVAVLEVQSFDDVKGEFDATTDLRLRWVDPRLRYEATGLAGAYREYRGKEAEEKLEKLWTPNVDVANRGETTGYVGHRLRVFADGQVETIVRATGHFKTDLDIQSFPFDSQALKQTLIVRDQTTDEVMLHFDKDDEEFSRALDSVTIDSWKIGDVDLESSLASGWNGDRYSRVTASLMVQRFPSTGLTTIFIPLLASLLIPLLSLWMNRATPEGFEIDAFELANMSIGGLFSVIALSYAVSSSYGSLGGSDNTVTRLFALNYATLALSLGVVVLFYQYNVVLKWFGPYVHQQAFKFVLWALPVLSLATAVAFVLIAAC